MKSLSIAVVGVPGGWHVGRLEQAALRRGHRIHIVPWEAFGTELAEWGPERFVPACLIDADVVLVRGMPAARLRERPGGGLEEILFRMNLLGRLESSGKRIVNSPRSLEIAIDKYLTLALLAGAGLPIPHTIVAQSSTGIREAWETLGRDAVVKPLFGSGGEGIRRLRTERDVDDLVAGYAAGAVVFLQRFVPHPGWDVRVLVVGNSIHAIRRVARDGEWRTNLTLGGQAAPIDLPHAWADLAIRASRIVGTEVAGVDLLPLADGTVAVCEVNGVPGWKGLAAALEIDPAMTVIRFLEQ